MKFLILLVLSTIIYTIECKPKAKPDEDSENYRKAPFTNEMIIKAANHIAEIVNELPLTSEQIMEDIKIKIQMFPFTLTSEQIEIGLGILCDKIKPEKITCDSLKSVVFTTLKKNNK